ncbi:hypothetical protein, variant [Aphanomyces invadans]|uniref:EGF-like domain-containing protein n=1 Tax=Aphanomyces invadans TaxID=157072 RepID=A0A024TSW9_9STRA|nr:hypothetical protein, variant [Aphanomyces invadans]ETV97250.1 hypothetical protein, variant [Aphanomyces invadans]|eukprot:XP_008873958.1 hypothetical protein, variant [Aphanomyces invadans]
MPSVAGAVLAAAVLLHRVVGQTALPKLTPLKAGCLESDVVSCKMNCAQQYKDEGRFTCPCYSKMGECLVRIGCSFAQRKQVITACTRKGYCKVGYCTYRAGDLTPKNGVRPEIFSKTAIVPPGSPCVDGCCRSSGTACNEDPALKSLREPGRAYRNEEVQLPPRRGDPRLSVNQNYDLMPYSIPLDNLPPVDPNFLLAFRQAEDTGVDSVVARNKFYKPLNGTLS